MAQSNQSDRRKILWFVIDGALHWDHQGWEAYVRTPLCMLILTRCYQMPWFDIRCNRIAFGLFARWPIHEGDVIYRFNWEKKWAIKELVEREVAHGNDSK